MTTEVISPMSDPYDDSVSPALVIGDMIEASEIYHPQPELNPEVPAVALKLLRPVALETFETLLRARFALIVPPGYGGRVDASGRNEIAVSAEQYRSISGEAFDLGYLIAFRPIDAVHLDAFLRLVSESTDERPWTRDVSALSIRHPACEQFECIVANRVFDVFGVRGAGTIGLDQIEPEDDIPIHLDPEIVQPIARIATIQKELT